jgi:MFS family permease
MVGAAAAVAAAVGPLIGGFITTYLSWRIGFLGEVIIIAIVLSGIRLVQDSPYTGDRRVDVVGAVLSALGMGGVVLGILVWEKGGGAVVALLAVGFIGLGSLAWWLVKRRREGKPALLDAALFRSKYFRLGISSQTLQQIALGGLMITLPIFLQMVLEYTAMGAGLSLAPLSLSMFAVALIAGKKAEGRSPSRIIRTGFLLLLIGVGALIPIVPHAHSGWALAVPLLVCGSGLGLLVSQLNNFTLAPIEPDRVSEAAGVNSAGGSFGLSFGLAFAGAVMLGSLSLVFTHEANSSDVLSNRQADQVSKALEKNAEVMTNTHLEALLVGKPPRVKEEILRINTKARPISLQIALLIPLLAALLGLVNGFRMTRLPDLEPSASAESVLGG